MPVLTITFARDSGGIVTKQLKGDYVGAREDGSYTIIGAASKEMVTVNNADIGEETEPYTYEKQNAIEEFYIPTKAVYHILIEHNDPEPANQDERPLLHSVE